MTEVRTRVRVLVSGRVLGVGFRDSMRQLAERLHLGGWVRNLGDGRVEVAIEGPAAEVGRAVAWCKAGPPWATVESCESHAEVPVGETSFRVRSTEYAAR